MGIAIGVPAAIALTKLFFGAVDLWTDDADWKHDGKSLKVVDKALSVVGAVSGEGSGKSHNLRYTALVVAAFGDAFRAHWVNHDKLAPWIRGDGWLAKLALPGDKKKRRKEIQQRIRLAFELYQDAFAAQGDGLPGGGARPPIDQPLYRALWRAFADPKLADTKAKGLLELGDAKSELLLDLGKDGAAKRAFERDFSDAWRAALASPNGVNLRQYLVSEEEEARPEALRDLLLDNTASWRRQHVFATVDSLGDFPEMPLEDAYIEPLADVAVNGRSVENGVRVLGLLERLIPNNPIAFVSADMGHGKSLTARTLAWNCAQKARREQESVSPEMWWPVYVRCADDFLRSTTNDVVGIIKRALKRQALNLGKELGLDDPALSKFPQEQRILLLLDGLDEVSVAGKELTALLESLRDWSSPKRRCVIFSRPAALPDRSKDIPVVKIRKFGSEQVATWLERWAGFSAHPGPTVDQIEKKGLSEIVRVPILLLMVAYSWKEVVDQKQVQKADIYELFFREMAWGKLRKSGERQPVIFEAAESLHERLSCEKLLVHNAPPDGDEKFIDAMLWLMGRVAWEAKCCEFEAKLSGGSPDLQRSRIADRILRGELGCSGDTLHCIQIGLLLASQADLRNENHSLMLFGHRSFLEFLVARYWHTSLQLHVYLVVEDVDDERHEEIEAQLMWAPLKMDDEDRCDSFLYQLLATSPLRSKIGSWAKRYFLNEKLLPRKKSVVTLVGDQRTRLRGAALGIACECEQHPSLESSHALRSLLAWASVREEFMHVHARGLELAKHRLPRSNFTGSDLSAANMDAADLRFSSFVEADLTGAHLQGTDLTGAHLRGAHLRGAHLRGAHLTGAHLFRADLRGAHLRGADLRGADLRGAHLRGADLRGADLRETRLEKAKLQGAELTPEQRAYAQAQGAILEDPV